MQMTESRKPRRRKATPPDWRETQDRMLREQNDRIEYLNRCWRHRGLVAAVLERRYGAGTDVQWFVFGLSVSTPGGIMATDPTLRGLRAKLDHRCATVADAATGRAQ